MIAEETGLNKNAVHRILTDHLNIKKSKRGKRIPA
jgi:hypothetical protein